MDLSVVAGMNMVRCILKSLLLGVLVMFFYVQSSFGQNLLQGVCQSQGESSQLCSFCKVRNTREYCLGPASLGPVDPPPHPPPDCKAANIDLQTYVEKVGKWYDEEEKQLDGDRHKDEEAISCIYASKCTCDSQKSYFTNRLTALERLNFSTSHASVESITKCLIDRHKSAIDQMKADKAHPASYARAQQIGNARIKAEDVTYRMSKAVGTLSRRVASLKKELALCGG